MFITLEGPEGSGKTTAVEAAPVNQVVHQLQNKFATSF